MTNWGENYVQEEDIVELCSILNIDMSTVDDAARRQVVAYLGKAFEIVWNEGLEDGIDRQRYRLQRAALAD